MSRCLLCIALVAVVVLSGCGDAGPNLVPVNGLVTLDGKPLPNKSLMFSPIEGTAGNGAGGSTNSEGKYTLVAMVSGATVDHPGVSPGRYRVTLFESMVIGDAAAEGAGEPAVAVAPGGGTAESDIPPIYGTEQSPLILDVPESGGELNIELETNPGA